MVLHASAAPKSWGWRSRVSSAFVSVLILRAGPARASCWAMNSCGAGVRFRVLPTCYVSGSRAGIKRSQEHDRNSPRIGYLSGRLYIRGSQFFRTGALHTSHLCSGHLGVVVFELVQSLLFQLVSFTFLQVASFASSSCSYRLEQLAKMLLKLAPTYAGSFSISVGRSERSADSLSL